MRVMWGREVLVFIMVVGLFEGLGFGWWVLVGGWEANKSVAEWYQTTSLFYLLLLLNRIR
jgi:hypothetical protein